MKTINIKGKEYVTVNERLKEFRNNFKDYCLITEIVELGSDYATVKASVIDEKGTVRATGFAREVVAKSPINKFAFLENCETSAIGRALGNFGIGIDEAVCTADELLMKLSQDEKPEKTDFEKDAANEMRAKTTALKKGETVKPKGTLEERYTKACFYLMNNDGKPYKRSVIDSLNTLYKDLIEAGEKDKADDLKVGIDRIMPIDDEIVY